MKIEALGATHDRSAFDSGTPPLDKYLRETARQHIAKGISKTFVLVDESAPVPRPILGFFTIALCEVEANALPEKWSKRLPNKIPGLRLGRLAVAKSHQGKSCGRTLVMAAISRVARVASTVGGVGLFVDAKDESAAHFYEKLEFERTAPGSLQLFLPMQTLLQLAEGR